MAKETTKKLEQLNLVDKFLFDEIMEDREAYQAMISILLEQEIVLARKPETEKELRVSDKLRQVRLDVISSDKKGKIYYSEMQKRNTGNLRKRSRFYQAQLDVSLLEPGIIDFNQLNDSCFILIAPFDIFGRGLYRYTFEGVGIECPGLKLEDGAYKVFINTTGKNKEDFSEEFLDFMEYIMNSSDEVAKRTKSEKIKLIHERVKKIRLSEKMGVKYMQRWEELVYARLDGREEGEAIGEATGEKNGKIEGSVMKSISLICKKLVKKKTLEEIAEELEEEIEEIRPLYMLCLEAAPEYNTEQIWEKYKKNISNVSI